VRESTVSAHHSLVTPSSLFCRFFNAIFIDLLIVVDHRLECHRRNRRQPLQACALQRMVCRTGYGCSSRGWRRRGGLRGWRKLEGHLLQRVRWRRWRGCRGHGHCRSHWKGRSRGASRIHSPARRRRQSAHRNGHRSGWQRRPAYRLRARVVAKPEHRSRRWSSRQQVLWLKAVRWVILKRRRRCSRRWSWR